MTLQLQDRFGGVGVPNAHSAVMAGRSKKATVRMEGHAKYLICMSLAHLNHDYLLNMGLLRRWDAKAHGGAVPNRFTRTANHL
jgi:hypothetical protein